MRLVRLPAAGFEAILRCVGAQGLRPRQAPGCKRVGRMPCAPTNVLVGTESCSGRLCAGSTASGAVQIAWKTSDGRQHAARARACEVAASSVYFEVDTDAHLSSPDLLLELEPGQELSLCAVARVVRVEARGGKIGIAVVMEDYCFQAMP